MIRGRFLVLARKIWCSLESWRDFEKAVLCFCLLLDKMNVQERARKLFILALDKQAKSFERKEAPLSEKEAVKRLGLLFDKHLSKGVIDTEEVVALLSREILLIVWGVISEKNKESSEEAERAFAIAIKNFRDMFKDWLKSE